MTFQVKVSLAVVALLLVALAAVFLLRSSDEKEIEALLAEGLEAAERGDSEAVIALLSPNYKNGEETREGISRRIRQAVAQRLSPAKIAGSAIQVSGDDAEASVRVLVGLLQYRREFALRVRLRKENGVWKVTGADEAGP